jgi:hypothetical protein
MRVVDIARVTWLGKFSPVGCLLWAGFFITTVARTLVLLFSRFWFRISFAKKWVGLHFGRFFYKPIWSHCRTRFRQKSLSWKPISSAHEIGTARFSWYNVPKRLKINTKWPKNIPNGHETYPMGVNIPNGLTNTSHFHSKTVQNISKLVFLV